MNPDNGMRRAIDIARKSQLDGGAAIGALLVDKAGTVVASGESLVAVTNDPSAHAEITCIRAAARQMKTDDLYGLTLYSTLEPCKMCLSCAAWARITQVYFGAYRKDVDASLFETIHTPGDEAQAPYMNLREDIKMRVQGGILEKDCAKLLDGYHDGHHHNDA